AGPVQVRRGAGLRGLRPQHLSWLQGLFLPRPSRRDPLLGPLRWRGFEEAVAGILSSRLTAPAAPEERPGQIWLATPSKAATHTSLIPPRKRGSGASDVRQPGPPLSRGNQESNEMSPRSSKRAGPIEGAGPAPSQ